MGLLGTIVKVAAGTAAAKKVVEFASENITSDDLHDFMKKTQGKLQKIRCGKCGKLISGSAQFCPYCGTAFTFNDDAEETYGYVNYEDLDADDSNMNNADNSESSYNTNQNRSSFTDSFRNKSGSYYDGQGFSASAGSFTQKSSSYFEGQSNGSYTASDAKESDDSSGDKSINKTKCPNCYAIIDSFVISCPYCGFEINRDDDSYSAADLSDRLAKIDSRLFTWRERQKSALEGAIGVILKHDEKEDADREEAYKRFEMQKVYEKKALIIDYPIPDSIEGIMKFMLLAVSNINVRDGKIDEIEEAWITKMEHIYKHAEIAMQGNPKLTTIKSMYNQKLDEIDVHRLKVRKKHKILLIVGIALLIAGLAIALIGKDFYSHAPVLGVYMVFGSMFVFIYLGFLKINRR